MAMAQDLQSKNSNPKSKSSMEVNSLVFTKNKKISNSKLKRLSLRRSKSSQSDQIGSTSLTSVKTEGNLNHSFSPVIGSGLSNPFLQNLNKKSNQAEEYNYPTLQRNGSTNSTPSTSFSDHPQAYSYPSLQRYRSNIDVPSISKSSSCLGLKKCMSVSTLAESIESKRWPKSNSLKKNGKKVSFTNLQIREYELKLGDHPSCRSGPPITIGWNFSQKEDVSLDTVVDDDARKTKPRKKVDASTRYEMLRSVGYTNSEILQSDRGHRRQLKRAQSDATLMRGGGYAHSIMPMAVQEHDNSQNFTYPNQTSAAHSINKNQLYRPNSTKAVTLNRSLIASSNALSMKSNEILDDMSSKLKLLSKNNGGTMMHDPQRTIESNMFVSHRHQVKRAESDACLMRSAGYSYSGMLMAVQEHENVHNFSYPDQNSAVHSINENKLQQPSSTEAFGLNQPLVIAESNSLSVKSNEVLDNMIDKVKLLSKNNNNYKIQQPFMSSKHQLAAESNLFSAKSNEVVNDMGNKSKLLARNKNYTQQPLMSGKPQLAAQSNFLFAKSNDAMNDMSNKLKLLAKNKSNIKQPLMTSESRLAAQSNLLSAKSNDAMSDMSNKLKLLERNKYNIQLSLLSSEPQLTAQSNLLSAKSNDVVSDMSNKLKLLAKNKNNVQQPLLSFSANSGNNMSSRCNFSNNYSYKFNS